MNLPQWCQTHSFKDFLELMQEDNSFGHKTQEKGKNMSDFEIKETIVQTGYVDKDGKFVAETNPSKVEKINSGTVYVQDNAEDVQT